VRSWFNPQRSTHFDYIFRVLTTQEDITQYDTMTTIVNFRPSFSPGVLNAPIGPGRKFLEHEGILETRSKPFQVANKRVRAAIEDRHQGEASSKRRKLNSCKVAEDGKLVTFQPPDTWKCEVCFASFNSVNSGMCEACERRKLNGCMISEDGKLVTFQPPGTWKCEVCFASLNSVNSDMCEACKEPRPTTEEHKKPMSSSRDPGLFPQSKGSATGSITPLGFLFLGPPCGAEPREGKEPRPTTEEHKKPMSSSRDPGHFPESEGSATGNITPLGFLFLGPCGAEPREHGIVEIDLDEAPMETSPVIRRRVRAKRPKKRASSITTRSAEVATRSRTFLQRTGTRECELRKHGNN